MSQQTNNDISKWIKAVVNLEARSSPNGSTNEYGGTGSAVFVKRGNTRYLISALHVFFDPRKAIEYGSKDDFGILYQRIFRIRQEGEPLIYGEPMLGPIWVGTFDQRPHTVLPEADLIIINMEDRRCKEFADNLEKRGHVPVDISDIDFSYQPSYGDDIYCVGYPYISLIGTDSTTPGIDAWRSIAIMQPTVTFGKIASVNSKHITGDMCVVPGNSGGPVIHNNKMIGIVSAQPTGRVTDANGVIIPGVTTGLPYTIFYRPSFIKEIYDHMAQREGKFIMRR